MSKKKFSTEASKETISPPPSHTRLDLFGWIGYGIGFSLSVSGKPQAGSIVATISLISLIGYYSTNPTHDILNLQYKTRERINITLLIAFAIFIFLFKFSGLAIFCLGVNWFLFGCLSLKGQKIYVGQAWKLEHRTCYTSKVNFFRYWLWTSLFLLLGCLFLILPLLANRWFSK